MGKPGSGKRYCLRGHDVWKYGRTPEGRCVVCRRAYDLDKSRKAREARKTGQMLDTDFGRWWDALNTVYDTALEYETELPDNVSPLLEEAKKTQQLIPEEEPYTEKEFEAALSNYLRAKVRVLWRLMDFNPLQFPKNLSDALVEYSSSWAMSTSQPIDGGFAPWEE